MVHQDQWDNYVRMQGTAMASSSCSSAAMGYETAMTEILTAMYSGQIITEQEAERRVATCQRRERNQRAIVARSNFPHWHAPRDEGAAYEARIVTKKIETVLNGNECSILMNTANGYTAAEIGQAMELTEVSVRQRVRRARAKIAYLQG